MILDVKLTLQERVLCWNHAVGTQTPDFFGLCDQYTQTEPGLFDGEAWFFNAEEEPGSENESIENVSPNKDTSYIPSKSEESDDDEEEEVSMAVPSKLKPQTPSIYGTVGWTFASMLYMWGSNKQKRNVHSGKSIMCYPEM